MKDAQRCVVRMSSVVPQARARAFIRMSEDAPSSFDFRHTPSVRLFIHPPITTSESVLLPFRPSVGFMKIASLTKPS